MNHFTQIYFFIFSVLVGISEHVISQNRPYFNSAKDILIAQFDSKPDPDDIHAQAALGSLLAHPDFKAVKYLAVAGAYGKQGGIYIKSNRLFDLAFGKNNWTNAHTNRKESVNRIVKKVLPILRKGGKVWVQEAGQSNITLDWIKELYRFIDKKIVKNNVVVVQHSEWNQNHADNTQNKLIKNPVVLNFVKRNTQYFYLDDGNADFTAPWGDHGPWSTPNYTSRNPKWLKAAKQSKNSKIKSIWIEADAVVRRRYSGGVPYNWSAMKGGGVDYSDCVENWWIFNLGNKAKTVESFWSRYVINNPGTSIGGGNGDDEEDESDGDDCNAKVFLEKNGIAAVEAEDYVSQSKTSKRKWYLSTGKQNNPKPDPDPSHHQGASKGGYLEILPDTRVTHGDPLVGGVSFSNKAGEATIVSYKVKFANAGKYYVWVRAFSTGTEDNGVHVGLNGKWPASGQRMQWCSGKNAWTWESKQRTAANHCGEAQKIFLNIPNPGVHTIAFSMREDGFEMDKFILSKRYIKPVGLGPKAITQTCDDSISDGDSDDDNLPDNSSDNTNCSFKLGAVVNFKSLNVKGFSPAYRDVERGVLAIDASRYKNTFAAAQTTFSQKSGTYNVSLGTLTEVDGESTYRVVVNGKQIGSFKNPRSNKDFSLIQKTFTSVRINKGDVIRVEFNAHTNGLIPEENSTAYSRGRWKYLNFSCVSSDNSSEDNDEDAAGDDTSNAANKKPIVQIQNITKYKEGSNIVIQVKASDSDGKIASYQVFVNNQLVDTDQNWYTPYVIKQAKKGNYIVKVIVTDNQGAKATATKKIAIGAKIITQKAIYLPGTIEAESFLSKTGGIQIENIPNSSRKNIGYITNQTNTKYQVQVSKTGSYTFKFLASSQFKGGTIYVKSGNKILGSVKVTKTGNWNKYTTFKTTVLLKKGNQTLEMSYKGGKEFLLNLDKITVTKNQSIAPSVINLKPIADAYLEKSKRYNTKIVRIEKDKRTAFLKFDLSKTAGQIQSVQLSFTVFSDFGNGTTQVHKGISSNWTEYNLSTANQPKTNQLLGSLNSSYALYTRKTIKLDPKHISLEENTLNLVLSMRDGNDYAIASKENSVRMSPTLKITYLPAKKSLESGLTNNSTLNKVTIYPNPAKSISTIELGKSSLVKIYNLLGVLKKEFQAKAGNNPIDLSEFSSGYYIINVLDPAKPSRVITTKKLYKE